jgi:hypothetical protein
MAAIAGAKTIGPTFNNAEEVVHAYYDFSVDAGATGVLDLFTAGEAIVITGFHATVMTTCTSGGSATVIAGISGGDTDIFMNATQGAVASLAAAYTAVPPAVEGTPNVLPLPVALASGGKIIQTIGTATLTAGKIKYVIKYMKA